eukprot:1134718-Alexandrium_andersonii.AAC.1
MPGAGGTTLRVAPQAPGCALWDGSRASQTGTQHPALSPRVETNTALNSPLNSTEKVPEIRMEDSAAPSRPAGRNVLVPHSESVEVGDPF